MALALVPPTVSLILLILICLRSAASSSEIDFSQIPECAWGNCFPYHSSSIGCSLLTQDCFCNALEPIGCASSNCTGNDWYGVEDWFATQCPDPANVTFSQLPECSRACIRAAILPVYCRAQITQNCFCRLQSEFEGLGSCLQTGCSETAADANSTLVAYFRETCIYDPSADGSGDPDGADQVVSSPDGSTGGSSGATIGDGPVSRLQLGVGLAAGFIGLIGCVLGIWRWLHRQARRRKSAGKSDDPPPYRRYNCWLA